MTLCVKFPGGIKLNEGLWKIIQTLRLINGSQQTLVFWLRVCQQFVLSNFSERIHKIQIFFTNPFL